MASITILMHPKEVGNLKDELELQNPQITIHSVVTLDLSAEPEQVKFKPKPKFVLMRSNHSAHISDGQGQFIDFVSSIPEGIQYVKDNYEVSEGGLSPTHIEFVSERVWFTALILKEPIQYFYLIPIE